MININKIKFHSKIIIKIKSNNTRMINFQIIQTIKIIFLRKITITTNTKIIECNKLYKQQI